MAAEGGVACAREAWAEAQVGRGAAWRGGRIGTVQAITVGFAQAQNRPSPAARLATRLRLPVVVVLGLKDVFARPLRAGVTVAALALTVITLTFSIGMEATIDDMINHPERWGSPFDLVVDPRGAAASDLEQALADNPDVARIVLRETLQGLGPGGEIVLRQIVPLVDAVEQFVATQGQGSVPPGTPVRAAILAIASALLVRSAAGALREPLWRDDDDHARALGRALFLGGP